MSQNFTFSNDPNMVKELCSVSEKYATESKPGDKYKNWEVVMTNHDKDSNFKAVAFKKDDQIVVCYVGTSRKLNEAARDWGANAKMSVGKASEQMKQADEFYQRVAASEQAQGANISLGGHSEGGSEAQYVSIKNGGIPTYTYNAFMTGNMWSEGQQNQYGGSIVNFRHPDDAVSKLGTDIGYQVIVPSNSRSNVKQYGDATFSHKIDNMGDCNLGVPEKVYKQTHPNFAEKIKNTVITRENISKMEPETYKLYENTILLRHDKKSIPNELGAKKMALTGELVHVSAYTRDDGTRVDDYYRHAPAN